MLINTLIKKIGNSYYVLIPKYFIDDLKFKEDDKVSIDIKKIKNNVVETIQNDSNNKLQEQSEVENEEF